MPLNCGAGEDSWEFLKCKEIKPVNLKGNQPWIFFGRTDAEADTPVFCSWYEQLPHWKSLWCWERLRVEGEEGIRGWDGWMALLINGHELEQTSGDGEEQGGLACYSLRGCKELETTRQLNCNNNKFPTYKSSNFKLSKTQMCVHKFSHIS